MFCVSDDDKCYVENHVLNQKNIKSSSLIQAMRNSVCPKSKVIRRPSFPKRELSEVSELCYGFSTRHDNREVTLIEFFESRICSNIYRMLRSFRSFRSVDWTHDMIIVKWHLFIWHERKLCALTNAPPVQSTQIGQLLSTLFHANCSAAQVYVFPPWAIHIRSKVQATIILAGITIHWAPKKIFWKIFCLSDDHKCYDENIS